MAGLRMYATIEYNLKLTKEQFEKFHLEAVKKDIEIGHVKEIDGFYYVVFIIKNVQIKKPKNIKEIDEKFSSYKDITHNEEHAKKLYSLDLMKEYNETIALNNKENNTNFPYINNLYDLKLYKFKAFRDRDKKIVGGDVFNIDFVYDSEFISENYINERLSELVSIPNFIETFVGDNYLYKFFIKLISKLPNDKGRYNNACEEYKKRTGKVATLQDLEITDIYFKNKHILTNKPETNDVEQQMIYELKLHSLKNGMKKLLSDIYKISSGYSVRRYLYMTYIKRVDELIPSKIYQDMLKEYKIDPLEKKHT